jgi:anti-anti-sigma factor
MSDATSPTPIAIETKGHAVIAQPQLKLMDENELKALTRLIDQAAGPGSPITLVILDFSRTHFVPTMILGLLVQLSNKCKSREQKLKLAGLHPHVRKVFSTTKLDRVFDIASSVDAALQ